MLQFSNIFTVSAVLALVAFIAFSLFIPHVWALDIGVFLGIVGLIVTLAIDQRSRRDTRHSGLESRVEEVALTFDKRLDQLELRIEQLSGKLDVSAERFGYIPGRLAKVEKLAAVVQAEVKILSQLGGLHDKQKEILERLSQLEHKLEQ